MLQSILNIGTGSLYYERGVGIITQQRGRETGIALVVLSEVQVEVV